jgi:flagellin-like hook-associated protein FlgL
MPLTLNSTIAALSSQQNPKKTQGDISSQAQVLPSGKATPTRPERAVTISIDAQINRPRNTTHPPVIAFNEAIAVGQTAEKALDEINSTLVKIRETTRQAVTGQNTVINLNALNDQLLRLKNEINTIVENHHYKNTPVLKNGFSQSFPVDAQHTNTINLTLTDSSTHNLGVRTTAASDLADIAPASSTLKIPGTPVIAPVNAFSVTKQQQIPQHPEKTPHKTGPIDTRTLIPPAPVIHYQITLSPLEDKTLKQDKHILPIERAQPWPIQARPTTIFYNSEIEPKKSSPEFDLSLNNISDFTPASYELYRFTQTLLPDHSRQTTEEQTITHFMSDGKPIVVNAIPLSFDSVHKTDSYGQQTISLDNKPGHTLLTGVIHNKVFLPVSIDLEDSIDTFSNVQYPENTVNLNLLNALNPNPPQPSTPSLTLPIASREINPLKSPSWEIATTQSTVVNFTDFPVNKGDRISLTIQGQTIMQVFISKSDIAPLLTEMASRVTEKMKTVSKVNVDKGTLTLTHEPERSDLNELRLTIEPQPIIAPLKTVKTFDFKPLPLKPGDRLRLTVSGAKKAQGTLTNQGLKTLLTHVAMTLTEQTAGLSYHVSPDGLLTLTDATDKGLLYDLAFTVEGSNIKPLSTTVHTVDFTPQRFNEGDHLTITDGGNNKIQGTLVHQDRDRFLTGIAQEAIDTLEGITDAATNNGVLTLTSTSNTALSDLVVTLQRSANSLPLTTVKTFDFTDPPLNKGDQITLTVAADNIALVTLEDQNLETLLTEIAQEITEKIEDITDTAVNNGLLTLTSATNTTLSNLAITLEKSPPTAPLTSIKTFEFTHQALAKGDQITLTLNGDEKVHATLEGQDINTLLTTIARGALKQNDAIKKAEVKDGVLRLSGFKNHNAMTQTYVEIKRPASPPSLDNISLLSDKKARQSLIVINQAITDVTSQQLLLKTFQNQIHHAFSKLTPVDENLSLLTQGDLTAVVVNETEPLLIVESETMRFQSPPQKGLKVGQKMLLKVTDSSSLPPKIKLFKASGSPLLQLTNNNSLLHALLSQEQPLLPVEKALTDGLNQRNITKQLDLTTPDNVIQTPYEKNVLISDEEPASEAILPPHLLPPETFKADWVQRQLKHSGLFYKNSSLKKTGTPLTDLKQLFLLLQREDTGNKELTQALDGISASQVKALDADLQGGSYYSLLLPFLPGEFITLTLVQDEVQKINQQWHIYLESNTQTLGHFKVDIVLQKKTVAIQFRSNQDWLVSLIDSSKEKLIDRVESAGMSVSGVTAQLSKKNSSAQTKVNETEHAKQSVLSAKEQINQQTDIALLAQANAKKENIMMLLKE